MSDPRYPQSQSSGSWPPQQGGYQSQGGYGQQGYQPQAGYPAQTGYQQGAGPGPQWQGPASGGSQPPKKRSMGLVIGLIVLGILLAGGLGALVPRMVKKDPAPSPVATTQESPSPSPSPSEPSPSPSDTETPTPTPTPPGGFEVKLQNGIVVHVPDGWTVGDQDTKEDWVRLTDGMGTTIRLEGFVSEKRSDVLVKEFQDLVAGELKNPKRGRVSKINFHPNVDVSEGSLSGIYTSSAGSSEVLWHTTMSVRLDKRGFVSTMVYDPDADQEKLRRDYVAITNSGLTSQARL